MKKIKVENMVSSSGHIVPNQFRIYDSKGVYFQSYSTVIAFKNNNGQIFLDKEKWDCSVTTGRYRNQFLDENIEETRKKIKSGVYKLIDLN